jgi:hypothetical protein
VLFERFRAVSASIQKDDTIEFNEFQAGTVPPLPWVARLTHVVLV